MRLIDADKLIKEITIAQETLQTSDDKQWKRNKKYFKGLAWAHKIVLEQPTIEGELKWIPVTERLPDEHENYIVTVCDECNMIWAETVVVLAEYFEGSWLWYEGGDEYDITDMVIAWMPLPEAYKGDKL